MSELSPEMSAPPELHTVLDAYFVEEEGRESPSLAFSLIKDGEIRTVTIADWFIPEVIIPKQEGGV